MLCQAYVIEVSFTEMLILFIDEEMYNRQLIYKQIYNVT